MPIFTVEAMDPKGKRVRADIEANNAQDAIGKVKGKGYKPMNVKEKADGASSSPKNPAATATATPAPGGPQAGAIAAAAAGAMPAKKAAKGLAFLAGRVKHKQ